MENKNLSFMTEDELKNEILFFGAVYEEENIYFEIMKNFCNKDYKMSIYPSYNNYNNIYIDFNVSNSL